MTESHGQALERIGLKENELVGFNYLDPSAPHHEEVKRALAGEAVGWMHTGVYEGERLHFRNYLLPDKVSGKGLVHFAVDITELTEAQEELKVQSLVLHSMAEGVNVSDKNGNIFYTNPAFDAMFGYSRGELIGADVSVLNASPPDENRRLVRTIVEGLKARGIWSGELHNRKKDGTNFFTSTSITNLTLSDRIYAISVQEDITECKRAEQSRERALADLQEANQELNGLCIPGIPRPAGSAACDRWLHQRPPERLPRGARRARSQRPATGSEQRTVHVTTDRRNLEAFTSLAGAAPPAGA